MSRTLASFLFAGGLFVGMIALLELGRWLGRRRLGRDEEGARAGLGAVEGARVRPDGPADRIHVFRRGHAV